MKIQEQLLTEVKLGKIVEEDGVYYLVEVDKDGLRTGRYEINELCEPYVNKEYVKFKIEYSRDIN